MRVSRNWVLGLVLLAGGPVHAADALSAAAEQVAAGDYRAALATLDRLEGAAAGAAPVFLRAAALAGSGRLDEAAVLFERLIAEYPQLPEAYNNLAALRARQGRLAEAKELLERALGTDARYATVYENLSTIYVEMARTSYAKALRMEAGGAQAPRLTVLSSLADAPAPAQVAMAPVPPPVPAAPPAAAPAPAPVAPPTVPAAPVVAEPVVPVPAPVAVPVAVAPEPEPEVATVPEPVRLAVATALNGWAQAWSEQDVDAYLAYYEADYAPEGMERQVWEAERRSRIGRPAWIKVQLEDMQMEALQPDAVAVNLRQRYAAPGYKDTTVKRLILTLRDGNWMITTETNIKVQR